VDNEPRHYKLFRWLEKITRAVHPLEYINIPISIVNAPTFSTSRLFQHAKIHNHTLFAPFALWICRSNLNILLQDSGMTRLLTKS